MPDPFTALIGLAWAGSQFAGEPDNPVLKKLRDLAIEQAGHLTSHFAHADLERARESLHEYFEGHHPEKNLDLERAVTRSSLHADIYCLMEALHEPLEPPKGRIERWRRLILERAPESLQSQPKTGVLTTGTQTTLRKIKEDREKRLREIEKIDELDPPAIDPRLLLKMAKRQQYGASLTAAALTEIESNHGKLPTQARAVFQQRWFPYLCGFGAREN